MQCNRIHEKWRQTQREIHLSRAILGGNPTCPDGGPHLLSAHACGVTGPPIDMNGNCSVHLFPPQDKPNKDIFLPFWLRHQYK